SEVKDELRHVVFRYASRGQIFEDPVRVRLPVPARHDGKTDALTEPRIGKRESRGLRDRLMAQCQRLDRRRVDVAPAADDHVLLAAGDAQITRFVEPPEIA